MCEAVVVEVLECDREPQNKKDRHALTMKRIYEKDRKNHWTLTKKNMISWYVAKRKMYLLLSY